VTPCRFLPAELCLGGEAIHPNDLGNTEVLNFTTSIDNRLKDLYKWKGQALGAIGLNLSGDNEKVIGGQFVTRGTTGFKELKFPCNFVWEDSSADIYLALNIPTLDIFSFDNGGPWSNIVPSASIVHSYHKTSTGEVVLADERNEQGVGSFSVRMNCQLSSSSDCRFASLLSLSSSCSPPPPRSWRTRRRVSLRDGLESSCTRVHSRSFRNLPCRGSAHHPLSAARGTLLRPRHGPVRQQAARHCLRYHAEMRPTGGTGERAQRHPEVGGDPSQPQDAARQAIRNHLALCGDDSGTRR
jgi:hypothetical protein